VPNFVLIGLFCHSLVAKDSKFCRFFLEFSVFVVSSVGGNLRKLNTDAQLQIFPYPTVSKSFLYAFVAKSSTQYLAFKSMTDKPTDKKLNIFGCPGGG